MGTMYKHHKLGYLVPLHWKSLATIWWTTQEYVMSFSLPLGDPFHVLLAETKSISFFAYILQKKQKGQWSIEHDRTAPRCSKQIYMQRVHTQQLDTYRGFRSHGGTLSSHPNYCRSSMGKPMENGDVWGIHMLRTPPCNVKPGSINHSSTKTRATRGSTSQ